MPTPESDALREHFASLREEMAGNPDMGLLVLRALFDGLAARTAEPTAVTYREVDADGVPALWCEPVDATDGGVILYAHGGGFVTNSASSHRKLVGHLAKAAGTRALVFDYRLAPEHPFPAQLDDAVTTYQWLRSEGAPGAEVVIAGDSAGGNLALALTVKLRALGAAAPAAVLAFSPWLDMEHGSDTLDSNAHLDALIDRDMVVLMSSMFLGPDGRPDDPLANPLVADLEGFPPVYLTVGDAEVLLDDSRRFADRLTAAGGAVHLEVAAGQQHIYPVMAGRAPEADATIAAAGAWFRTVLQTSASSSAGRLA